MGSCSKWCNKENQATSSRTWILISLQSFDVAVSDHNLLWTPIVFYLVLKDYVTVMGTFNSSNREKQCKSGRRKISFQNNCLEESFVISAAIVFKILCYLFSLFKCISWHSRPAWYMWVNSGKKKINRGIPN